MTRLGEIIPGVRRVLSGYDQYRTQARNADILLWTPTNLGGRLIARGTKGPFSHASLVVKHAGRVWQGAYSQFINGFLSPLSGEVRRHPGTISVFRICTEEGQALPFAVTDEISERFANSLGGDYAWRNIRLRAYAALGLDRVIGRWVDLSGMIAAQCRSHTGAVCSQSVVRSIRAATRMILCPGIDECLVSPNDIGRSKLIRYIATLAWSRGFKK